MKHGGCYDCKSTSQEVLVSTLDKAKLDSIALCDACRVKREKDGTS